MKRARPFRSTSVNSSSPLWAGSTWPTADARRGSRPPTAWRSLVPAENAPEFARHPVQTLWLGPDRHLVHYPISGGAQIDIVAFGPAYDWTTQSWSAEGRIEDLRAEFAGWSDDLCALLAAARRTGRWALLDRDPLPRWTGTTPN